MSEIKLLHCPFCGGEARLMSVIDDGEVCINYEDELDMNHSFIHCYNCDMDFIPHTETAREVLEAWNTRKPMERIIERLEGLRAKPTETVYDTILVGSVIEIVKEEGGIE